MTFKHFRLTSEAYNGKVKTLPRVGGALELAYFSKPEHARKPTAVLIPGWTCNGSYFSEQIAELAEYRNVVVVNNPGIDGSRFSSSGPRAYVTQCRDDLEFALKYLDIRDVHLIGHSMGAEIALALASDSGLTKVRSVALLTPVITNPIETLPDDMISFGLKTLLRWLNKRVEKDGGKITKASERITKIILRICKLATQIKMAFKPPEMKEANNEFWKHALTVPITVVATTLQGMMYAGNRAFARFCKLKLPTLIIAAQHDPLVDPQKINKIVRRENTEHDHSAVKRGTTIMGVTHFLHLEKPELVNGVLNEFMSKNEGVQTTIAGHAVENTSPKLPE